MRIKKLLSVLIAGILVLSSMGFTAFAEAGTIPVETLEDLKAALDAETGSTVTVTGDIALDGPITFANPITFEIAEGGILSYTSDTNSQLYLVTLQDGSTFNLAEGAQVVMNGDKETQDTNRDWRAIYSSGDLVCDTLAGSITINHARGRALYANNDLKIGDMAADILMDNPNGANRYMYGIVSYGGNITMDRLSGSVKIVFGGGNNGYAIAAQSGSVTVNGDITGTVETQLGTSHAGIAIYAANSVTVTGDISGSVYARGGSGSGYAIYADSGDVAIARISGMVAGDCYNEIMENSQTGASAIYAGGSIYGSNDGGYTPINLTGTLSSKVGRSDAYTVNAGGSVYINIEGEGKILAQSSYGADFQGLEPGYEPMTNNWGGVAAGVIGNDIHVTGNDGAITVVSESETGALVDSSALVESTTRENIDAVSGLLYNVARGDTEAAKEIAATMTDEQKGLITNFEEIEEGLTSIRVTDAASLAQALLDAEADAVIVLQAGEYDMSTAAADSVLYVRKPVTIRGEGDVVFKGSVRIESSDVTIEGLKFTSPVIIPYGDAEPICIDINTGSYDNIAIRGCTFETEQYAASTGKRYKGIVTSGSGTYNGFTVDGCTFINLETAVTINPGASNVTVSNNEMTGTGSIFNKASFLKMHGTHGLTVTGNTVDNADIYLRPDWSKNPGSNIVINNNSLTDLNIVMDDKEASPVAAGETFDISKNYWGGEISDVSDVLSGLGAVPFKDAAKLDSYYSVNDEGTLSGLIYNVSDPADLQTVINNAEPGSIVNVPAGKYPQTIEVNKAITLKGSPDAVFTGGAIKVSAAGAVLDGINVHFEGQAGDPVGNAYGNLWIQADNVTVKNSSFYGNYTNGNIGVGFGIVSIRDREAAEHVYFENCTFETNTMGIFPAMKSGSITNCTFKPVGDTKPLAVNGIGDGEDSIVIEDNTFYGMRLLPYGDNITVTGNQFLDFSGSICYIDSAYGEFENIDVSKNYFGSENPDIDKILGSSGVLSMDSYYTAVSQDGTLTGLAYIVDDAASFAELVENAADGETIDLGGKTVAVTSQIDIPKTLTIKNGTIDITGAEISGDCIIKIGDRTNPGHVTFDNVDFVGSDYSSAFAVLYINPVAGSLNINNCNFDLENDLASSGGLIKSDGTDAKVTITDSVFNLTNPVRIFNNINVDIDDTVITAEITEGGIVDNAIRKVSGTITNSTITAKGFENGIKNTESGTNLTIDGNSVVTLIGSENWDIQTAEGAFITIKDTAKVYADKVSAADETIVTEGSGAFINSADAVSVKFVPTAAETVYDIVIEAANVETINRLTSADLTFANDSEGIGYEIVKPEDSKVNITLKGNDRYLFNFNGIDAADETGTAITLAQVQFDGYGALDFKIAEADTNIVNATEIEDNVVSSYYVGGADEGEGELIINDAENAGVINTELAQEKNTLTVNITFPNAVSDNKASYQSMKAQISGGDLSEDITYTFGSDETALADGKYSFTAELTEGISYTVTISGAGYRTARYTVNMSEAKTLTFWNNVMDADTVIEQGNDASKAKVTFLAGDIVKDNNINIYDLSAVVSYFGTVNDVTAASDYAKYDLNRDGKIDSKDVAMVLVSWGN